MHPERSTSLSMLDARRRAALTLGAFALGIIGATELSEIGIVLWFALACLGLAIALITDAAGSRFGFFLAVVAIAGGLTTSQLAPEEPGSLATFLPGPDTPAKLIEIEGLILTRPETFTPKPGALAEFLPPFRQQRHTLRFSLALRHLFTERGAIPAAGTLTVWLEAPDSPLRAGDTVHLVGYARALGPPANPGRPDFRPRARDRGLIGSIAVDESMISVVPAKTKTDRLLAGLLHVRSAVQSRAADIIERAAAGDPRAGPIMRGLILGQRQSDPLDVFGSFQRVGLAHLLAVSGFHVAVAAGIALLMIRFTGDRGRIEPILVCLALGLYMLIVPMRAPMFRAAVMVLALLIGDALGRRHDRIAVLSWVAIAWLAMRPTDLFTLGFQLSFGLTAWLMVLATPRPDALPDLNEPTPGVLVMRWLKKYALTLAAMWTVATPVLIFHLGIISPLAMLASIVTVPLIVLSMWLGFMVLLLGVLIPPLAIPAASALRFTAGSAAAVVQWFDSMPLATLWLPRVSVTWTIATVLVMLWLWRRGSRRDWRVFLVLAGVLVWFGVEARVETRLPNSTGARIHMLDVGSATAILVRSGDQNLLWDCGSWSPGVGTSTITPACRSLGAPRVRTVILTHANIDHYMGILDIIKPLGVRTVITGESFNRAAAEDPEGAPAHVLNELQRLGVEHRTVSRGDTLALGPSTLRFIHPPKGFAARSENDNALVAILEPLGDSPRALFTGDIQREAIATVLENEPGLHAAVIELPHHGSARESAYEFTRIINPKVILQSTDISRLDDPRWDPVRPGRTWLVTARDGCSTVLLNRDGSLRAGVWR
ncbi:MAG TPA: ComEC/Rec2 family competence protein [Phycisphaerales bacterium]|nr:ComEC/Rec2 family competence protein [Phycisphaerales bacterium]